MKFPKLNVPESWSHYWSKYPEGFTILESLISWVSQVDKMTDKLNDNQDDIQERVTKKELKETRKLDEKGNFTGSWFGLNKPTLSEEGMRATVEKIANEDIPTINLSLEQLAINPINFGAIGDGITDDTIPFKKALAKLKNNSKLLINDSFKITETLNISNLDNIIIEGQGTVIASNIERLFNFSNCKNLKISGLSFKGINTPQCINIYDSSNCEIRSVNIDNFIGNNAGGIRLYKNCTNTKIEKCSIENILGTSVGYGILVEQDEILNHSEFITIKDCYIKNIQPSADGDGIKFLQKDCNNYATIDNCTFIYCSKRAIKMQGNHNNVLNCKCIGGMVYTSIDFQTGNGTIKNCYCEFNGLTYTGVTLKGKNNEIDGLIIKSNILTTNSKAIMIDEPIITKLEENGFLKINNITITGFSKPLEFIGNETTSFSIFEIKNINVLDISSQYAFISKSTILFDFLKIENVNIPIQTNNNYQLCNSFKFKNCYIDNNNSGGNIFEGIGFDRTDKRIIKCKENGNGYYVAYDQIGTERIIYDYRVPAVGQSWQGIYKSSKIGDIVKNTKLVKLGTTENQYYIEKWICVADSDGTNQGVWVENRVNIIS